MGKPQDGPQLVVANTADSSEVYFISQFNYIQFDNTLHQKLIYLVNNIFICLYNVAIGQFRMHVIFIFKIIHYI